MLKFKKLSYKNLLGSGNYPTEIVLDANASTLVVGENGAGKSTFLDALCFGLYNKSYRTVNKPQLVNTVTNRNLVVEVEFETGNKAYRVIRGMKPTVFEIYRDGVLLDQTTGVTDYQAMLEKQILKMNFKSFTQIVILGSSGYTPFMKLPAMARREVIEDLLDIQVFSVMNSLLKDKIGVNKGELQALEYQVDLCRNKIDLNEKHIQALKENNEALIREREDKIAELQLGLVTHQNEIDVFKLDQEDTDKSLSTAMQRLSKLSAIIGMGHDMKAKIERLERDVAFYETNENCPTCKQHIDDFFREDTLTAKQKAIDKLKQGLQDMETERREKVELETSIREYEKTNKQLQLAIAGKKASIKSDQRYIYDLTMEVESYRNKASEILADDDVTRKLYTELDELSQTQTKLQADREVFQAASVLLKDGGIKGKIVSQYIPIMNKLINHYLTELDFFVDFQLDENFNEKIKSRFRDEFSYESFSEGEKVRINLALLFAWMAIAKMRNSSACSLLIMDEVLDGSLDNEGTDLFIKLLGPLTEDRNIFVISHKWNMIDKFNRLLEFKKTKNFSYLM